MIKEQKKLFIYGLFFVQFFSNNCFEILSDGIL